MSNYYDSGYHSDVSPDQSYTTESTTASAHSVYSTDVVTEGAPHTYAPPPVNHRNPFTVWQ